MAIRVEFYAKDQVTASSILEFALSCGAVLQAYSEVDAPLEQEKEKRGPRGSYKKRKYTAPTTKRARMDYKNTLVQVIDPTNNASKGSKRWQTAQIVLGHSEPMNLRDIRLKVQKKMPTQADATVRAILRDLIATKHLQIVD